MTTLSNTPTQPRARPRRPAIAPAAVGVPRRLSNAEVAATAISLWATVLYSGVGATYAEAKEYRFYWSTPWLRLVRKAGRHRRGVNATIEQDCAEPADTVACQ